MKIAVCLKRVPEMELRFAIGSDRRSLDQSGLKYEISDFDGYALEVGLQQVEKAGSGEVVAICLGPDGVQETLRKALAIGATRAVQLKADDVPFDGFAIASALAAELKDGGYDLILFGKQAADTASGAVGLMVAELLGMPMVQACTKLSFEGGKGIARREVEGGAEMVTFPLPGAASIDEGIARPRYPSLKGIMAAKKKPMDIKPAALGPARLTVTRMELPPERKAGRIIGEGAAAVPKLVRLLRDLDLAARGQQALALAHARPVDVLVHARGHELVAEAGLDDRHEGRRRVGQDLLGREGETELVVGRERDLLVLLAARLRLDRLRAAGDDEAAGHAGRVVLVDARVVLHRRRRHRQSPRDGTARPARPRLPGGHHGG